MKIVPMRNPPIRIAALLVCAALWGLLPGMGSSLGAAPSPGAEGGKFVDFPGGSMLKESGDTITGILYAPQGAGPFPAMVLLHGCSGIRDVHREMALRLSRWNVAALVVDSLSTRGAENCWKLDAAAPLVRVGDAYGALVYLQGLPNVDSRRVGLMGWSHGGWVLMNAMRTQPDDSSRSSRPGKVETIRFQAAIAYYPFCPPEKRIFYAPLLILIGEEDDWTPAGACRYMLQQSAGEGSPVDLQVYPGATHSFDRGQNKSGGGHRIAYDPAATEDSIRRVKAFLERHLRFASKSGSLPDQ